jgi:hypothetical protein
VLDDAATQLLRARENGGPARQLIRARGTLNPDSTNRVYISKTLSQETKFSNADFLSWSLSNIPLGSSTPALLNKMTRHQGFFLPVVTARYTAVTAATAGVR